MNHSPRRVGSRSRTLVLTALLAGCASQSSNVERLPFHVAIAPPVVRVDEQMASQQRDGDATTLSLAIDALTPNFTFSRIITPVFVFMDWVRLTCDCQGWGRRAAAWFANSLVLGFHSAPAPTEVAASSITSKQSCTHRAEESNSGSFPSFAACAESRYTRATSSKTASTRR